MIWELKHSVIANADQASVWSWHSNVENWVRFEGNAIESITLDGPFQAGTHMTSTLIKVEPPTHTVIEMQLSDAVLRFDWTFEALSDHQTRLTQRVILDGPKADAYVPFMEQHFAPNIVPGMERIAEEIAKRFTGGQF